jgi:hypothetical protein
MTTCWTEEKKCRESTHLSVLKVIASMPAHFGMDSLSASDLAAIQTLLRTEVNASAFSILHQGAAYRAAYEKLVEANQLVLSRLALSVEQSATSTSAQERSTNQPTEADAGAPMESIQ